MNNSVNHPTHYNSLPATCDKCGDTIECIEIVRHMNFNLGNAIKYIWRAGYKGSIIEDLEKAKWYIENEIARIENKNRDDVQKYIKKQASLRGLQQRDES